MNQAMLEAMALLGGNELPEAVHTPKAKRQYRRRAPKPAIAITPSVPPSIDALIARKEAEVVSGALADNGAPSKIFITAGKATFTISKLATGERFTYRIEKPENFRGDYFGSVMKGSDNETDYRYIGMISDRDLALRFTKGSKFQADSKEARGLAFALAVVAGRKTLPEGYELRRSNHCGRCGRLLTVPSSIDAGIGPDCAEKMMGIAA